MVAVAAKLREMADEFRIMASVADITDLAAGLNKNAVPPTPDLIGTGAVPGAASLKPKRKRKKRPVK